jgi:hypothetical protein
MRSELPAIPPAVTDQRRAHGRAANVLPGGRWRDFRLDVNVRSVLYGIAAALPYMKHGFEGRRLVRGGEEEQLGRDVGAQRLGAQ